MSEASMPSEQHDLDPEARSGLQHVVAVATEPIPLVPAQGVFEGQVEIRSESRIDGCVRGVVRGGGRLELGPGARIEGVIECQELCSEGTIVGPVVATERIRLRPGAVVEGDLDAPRLEVADSAVVNGRARIGSWTAGRRQPGHRRPGPPAASRDQ